MRKCAFLILQLILSVCWSVCIESALSGLNFALSGLKSALSGPLRPSQALCFPSQPERADFRPERADFRPERAWGRRTDKRTNKSPPVFYRTLSPSGPLPNKGTNKLKSSCVLQDIVPFGPLPCFPSLQFTIRQSRATGIADHILPLGDLLLYWAEAPKGTKSCRTQGDFCPSVRPSMADGPMEWTEGQV